MTLPKLDGVVDSAGFKPSKVESKPSQAVLGPSHFCDSAQCDSTSLDDSATPSRAVATLILCWHAQIRKAHEVCRKVGKLLGWVLEPVKYPFLMKNSYQTLINAWKRPTDASLIGLSLNVTIHVMTRSHPSPTLPPQYLISIYLLLPSPHFHFAFAVASESAFL